MRAGGYRPPRRGGVRSALVPVPGTARADAPRAGWAGRSRALLRTDAGTAAALAGASLANNVLGLAFTVVFTRRLGVGGYTSLAALVAAFLILFVAGQAMQAAAARSVALGVLAGGRDVRATVRSWTARLLAVALVGVVVGIAVRGPLARLVGVPGEEAAAAALPAMGVLWALLSVQRGALQGLRDYGALGTSIVAEGVLRLVFALVLVGVGGAVGGVTGAFLGAPIAYLALCAVLAGRIDHDAHPVQDGHPRTSLRSLVRVERWAIVGLLGVAVLQNVDTILARRELPDALAGSYASAAVAAKAIVWVAVGLALHLLPEATARAARGEDARGVLLRAFGTVALLGLPALAIFAAAPSTILRLAFGDEYTAAPTALPLLGAAMGLLAVTLLAVQHLVALGRRGHLPVLALCAVVEIAVLGGEGSSATRFALVVLVTQAVAAAATATMALRARPSGA